MTSGPKSVWWFALCALALACGGSQADSQGAVPPPLPTNFQAGPALAAPDPLVGDSAKSDYLRHVELSIQPRWASFLDEVRLRLPPNHELNRADLVALVDIALNRDGEVASAEIARSSGQLDFDLAAVEVARDAGPYPQPPTDVVSDDGKVHLRWAFARDRRQAGAATASLEELRWPLARAIPAQLAAGRIDEALARIQSSDEPDDARSAMLDAWSVAVIGRGLDDEQRLSALRAVTRGRVSELRAKVLEALAAADSPEPRARAIEALAATGGLTDAEIELADIADPTVARAVARGYKAEGKERQLAAQAEARLSGDKAAKLVSLAVLAELASDDEVAALAKLAQGGDREVRLAALMALGTAAKGGSASAASALIQIVKDRDAGVRASACQALARAELSGARRRGAYWAAIELRKDRDDQVRGACAKAAAHLEPSLFARDMRRLLADKAAPVRLALAQSLGGVPGGDALQSLISLSNAEEAAIRAATVGELFERSEAEAKAAIERLAQDDAPEVQMAVLARGLEAHRSAALAASSVELQVAALEGVPSAGRQALVGTVLPLLGQADAGGRIELAGAWLASRPR